MAITFQCPACRQSYQVRDDLVGRKIRCTCGRDLRIGSPSPATPSDLGQASSESSLWDGVAASGPSSASPSMRPLPSALAGSAAAAPPSLMGPAGGSAAPGPQTPSPFLDDLNELAPPASGAAGPILSTPHPKRSFISWRKKSRISSPRRRGSGGGRVSAFGFLVGILMMIVGLIGMIVVGFAMIGTVSKATQSTRTTKLTTVGRQDVGVASQPLRGEDIPLALIKGGFPIGIGLTWLYGFAQYFFGGMYILGGSRSGVRKGLIGGPILLLYFLVVLVAGVLFLMVPVSPVGHDSIAAGFRVLGKVLVILSSGALVFVVTSLIWCATAGRRLPE